MDPEARASHIVVTAKGAEVFHDACALAADPRITFHEKHLMENVVAAAREVDAGCGRRRREHTPPISAMRSRSWTGTYHHQARSNRNRRAR